MYDIADKQAYLIHMKISGIRNMLKKNKNKESV